MKNKIKQYANNLGIEYCGFTSQEGKTAIVFLFPYFCKYDNSSNISIYTYGEDYHVVIKRYLENVCEHIKSSIIDFNYEIYADVSPYNDIELAQKAGLGYVGKHGLLINEKYGSYVFIGYIITDTEFEADIPESKNCINCNKCIESCPQNALSTKDFSKCTSFITQKKGELTEFEDNVIKKNGYAFGCDICQKVCPLNKGEITPIKEFKEKLTTKISISDFENLSNKEFKEKFGNKAFAWRGKNVLIRNLTLLENEEENPQE